MHHGRRPQSQFYLHLVGVRKYGGEEYLSLLPTNMFIIFSLFQLCVPFAASAVPRVALIDEIPRPASAASTRSTSRATSRHPLPGSPVTAPNAAATLDAEHSPANSTSIMLPLRMPLVRSSMVQFKQLPGEDDDDDDSGPVIAPRGGGTSARPPATVDDRNDRRNPVGSAFEYRGEARSPFAVTDINALLPSYNP